MPSHYSKNLIRYAEFHTHCTWEELEAEFEKSKWAIRQVLNRNSRRDLIDRINRNSGIANRPHYGNEMIRYLNTHHDVTWQELEFTFGVSVDASRATLLRHDRPDLVERLDG